MGSLAHTPKEKNRAGRTVLFNLPMTTSNNKGTGCDLPKKEIMSCDMVSILLSASDGMSKSRVLTLPLLFVALWKATPN